MLGAFGDVFDALIDLIFDRRNLSADIKPEQLQDLE
jgi:hypothetical protein